MVRPSLEKEAQRLAEYLNDTATNPEHNNAASLLKILGRVYGVAYEMVHAKTHEHSRAAYMEMIDLIKGKANE